MAIFITLIFDDICTFILYVGHEFFQSRTRDWPNYAPPKAVQLNHTLDCSSRATLEFNLRGNQIPNHQPIIYSHTSSILTKAYRLPPTEKHYPNATQTLISHRRNYPAVGNTIMAEASFAKTFLTTLDSRPIKLSADHVEDARNFPSRPPVRSTPTATISPLGS